MARCDNCFFVYLGLPNEAIPRHQRFSLALWLTLLGCTLLVAASATSQEVEPTPTSPEVEPTPKSPEVEPTPISPEVEPTTIPESEIVAPEVSPPEAGAPELSEEVGEPVELLPTTEPVGGARWHIAPHILAKVTYDDNIFIQPSHERGDFIFTLAPGITFGYWELEEGRDYRDYFQWKDAGSLIERARGNFLIADYTAFLLGYARTSSENTVDHDGRVAFRWELAKLTLGATLDAGSKTEADPDVGERVRVRSLAINITSRYQVSDKTLLGLALSNTINDPDGFIQTTEWRAEGFAEYAVTPLIQLGLGMAGGRGCHRPDLRVRIRAERLRVDAGNELRADEADPDWAHGHSSVLRFRAALAAPRTPARFPRAARATVIRPGGTMAARASAAETDAANLS